MAVIVVKTERINPIKVIMNSKELVKINTIAIIDCSNIALTGIPFLLSCA